MQKLRIHAIQCSTEVLKVQSIKYTQSGIKDEKCIKIHPIRYRKNIDTRNNTRTGVRQAKITQNNTRTGVNGDKLIEIIPYRVYNAIMSTIGEFVKKERKKAGLTQEEFAMRSGLGLRFVRELEQGKPTVRLDKVNQALSMFGMEAVPGRIGGE